VREGGGRPVVARAASSCPIRERGEEEGGEEEEGREGGKE